MMNILIVEDNAAMRRLIRTLVGDLADAVYECEDGAQALAAYQQHQPDWVLMDIRMPTLDGISASHCITESDPQAKILIVTDYDDEWMRAAAAQAGTRGYILKDRLLDLRSILANQQESESHNPCTKLQTRR